jgi:hypothetical protein
LEITLVSCMQVSQVEWFVARARADLEIDGVPFRMDKGDVWNLYCIAESAFNRMKDPVQFSQNG